MIKCPLAQGPLWARATESWLFEWPKVKASTCVCGVGGVIHGEGSKPNPPPPPFKIFYKTNKNHLPCWPPPAEPLRWLSEEWPQLPRGRARLVSGH